MGRYSYSNLELVVKHRFFDLVGQSKVDIEIDRNINNSKFKIVSFENEKNQ